jgi:Fur family ferric uptake transcriptional regulator
VEPRKLDRVRAVVREEFGYEARFTHFPIAGLCPSCAGGGLRAVGEEDEPHAHP